MQVKYTTGQTDTVCDFFLLGD